MRRICVGMPPFRKFHRPSLRWNTALGSDGWCGIDSHDLNPIKRIQHKAGNSMLGARSRQLQRLRLRVIQRIPRQPSLGKQINEGRDCPRPLPERRLHLTVTQFITRQGIVIFDLSVGRPPTHNAPPETVSRAVPVGCHVGRRSRIPRQAKRRSGWRHDWRIPAVPVGVTPIRACLLPAPAVLVGVLGEPLLVVYTLRVGGAHIIIVKIRTPTGPTAVLKCVRIVVGRTEDVYTLPRPTPNPGLHRAGAIEVLRNRRTYTVVAPVRPLRTRPAPTSGCTSGCAFLIVSHRNHFTVITVRRSLTRRVAACDTVRPTSSCGGVGRLDLLSPHRPVTHRNRPDQQHHHPPQRDRPPSRQLPSQTTTPTSHIRPPSTKQHDCPQQ